MSIQFDKYQSNNSCCLPIRKTINVSNRNFQNAVFENDLYEYLNNDIYYLPRKDT